jgi:hypothetical protein
MHYGKGRARESAATVIVSDCNLDTCGAREESSVKGGMDTDLL